MSDYLHQHEKAFGMAGILLVTLIWGSAFVFMKNALDYITPLWLLAFRFLFASLALLLFLGKKIRLLDRYTLKSGLILALPLWGAYFSQTYGLSMTTAGNNAFITGTYVVFVPLLAWFFTKKMHPRQIIIGVATLLSMAVFVLSDQFTVGWGDMLTLLCALIFALHIVITEQVANNCNALLLAVVQIVAAAVFNIISALILEPLPTAASFNGTVFGTLLYTGVLSTSFALTVQNAAQRVLPAATASVLFTAETLFGAFFGWWLLDEIMSLRQLIGAVALLCCMLLSVTVGSRDNKKRAKVST